MTSPIGLKLPSQEILKGRARMERANSIFPTNPKGGLK